MVKIYTNTPPVKIVATERHIGQLRRTIRYDISELAAEEAAAIGYTHSHKQAALPPGVWNYDAIVDVLIRAEYPRDRMDAIINNYLADPTGEEAAAEMQQMQQWRAAAKALARAALAETEA